MELTWNFSPMFQNPFLQLFGTSLNDCTFWDLSLAQSTGTVVLRCVWGLESEFPSWILMVTVLTLCYLSLGSSISSSLNFFIPPTHVFKSPSSTPLQGRNNYFSSQLHLLSCHPVLFSFDYSGIHLLLLSLNITSYLRSCSLNFAFNCSSETVLYKGPTTSQ